NKPGRAIIQTYKPDNFVIQAVKLNDYKSFFESELKIRKAFSYPPYKNMITIRILNEDRVKTIELAKKYASRLRESTKELIHTEILGPNPCKISRINNKYRYNILIKTNDEELDLCLDEIDKIKNNFINKYKTTSFIVAINPVNIN